MVLIQQIKAIIVVDLDVAHTHIDLPVCSLLLLVEDVGDGAWNDTPVLVALRTSRHCECLPGSSLPIREYSPIEALKCTICYRLCNLVEYLLLGCFHSEDRIEVKGKLLLLVVHVALR